MRRLGPALVLLALLAPTARAQAPATARLRSCGEERAVFEGRMSALPGASRLQMRFVLQVARSGQGGWTRVRAAGWGRWVQARAGTRRFVYTRRVEGLAGPARYRAVVRFRWLDDAGELRARARSATLPCPQPAAEPALH